MTDTNRSLEQQLIALHVAHANARSHADGLQEDLWDFIEEHDLSKDEVSEMTNRWFIRSLQEDWRRAAADVVEGAEQLTNVYVHGFKVGTEPLTKATASIDQSADSIMASWEQIGSDIGRWSAEAEARRARADDTVTQTKHEDEIEKSMENAVALTVTHDITYADGTRRVFETLMRPTQKEN
jgi:hypothetical protein